MKQLLRTGPVRRGGIITGRVLWIDRFGNLITNIEFTSCLERAEVSVDGQPVGPIRYTYSEVAAGRPVAYIGSGGHLEIAVRDGSARDYFSVRHQETLKIEVALQTVRR